MALLDSLEEMIEGEFALKQKAQLKYMEVKQKKSAFRFKLLNLMSHEFLWSPTPIYYLCTAFLYILARRRWALKPYTFIPFLSIPITCDYLSKVETINYKLYYR